MYETILRKNGRNIEALVSLAAIHTHQAFHYRGIADSATERKKAKDLYDQVLRIFATGKEGQGPGKQVNKFIAKSERVREIARDPEMFIEIARLWADDPSLERSLQAYQEAERIMEEDMGDEPEPSAPLLNNIGVLLYQKGDFSRAQDRFEQALTEIGNKIHQDGGDVSERNDAVLIPCTYNLGVTLEVQGNKEGALDSYQRILEMHSEWVEGELVIRILPPREHKLISDSTHSQSSHRACSDRLPRARPAERTRSSARPHQRSAHVSAVESRTSRAIHLLSGRVAFFQGRSRLFRQHLA